MADQQGPNGTLSKTSTEKPFHLDSSIESGAFSHEKSGAFHEKSDTSNEKSSTTDQKTGPKPEQDDGDDMDMDALIDELESNDGHAEDEEQEDVTLGGARVVPEDQLMTNAAFGLTESEVHARRKKWGMNQMKEEKENLLVKFLWYFVGPIQFVMEVCILRLSFLSFFLASLSAPATSLLSLHHPPLNTSLY